MARPIAILVLVPFLLAAVSACGIAPIHQELVSHHHLVSLHHEVPRSHADATQADSDHDQAPGQDEDSDLCGTGTVVIVENGQLDIMPKADLRTITEFVYPAAFVRLPAYLDKAGPRTWLRNSATAPPGQHVFALTQRLRI